MLRPVTAATAASFFVLFGSAAVAETVTRNINVTVVGDFLSPEQTFDLNEDGVDDISVDVFVNPPIANAIDPSSEPTFEAFPEDTSAFLRGLTTQTSATITPLPDTGFQADISRTEFFALPTGAPQTFSNGDVIAPNPGQVFTQALDLYGQPFVIFPDDPFLLVPSLAEGPQDLLPAVGDSAVFGYKITQGSAFFSEDPFIALATAPSSSEPSLPLGFLFEGFSSITSVTFGFLEITRGSVVLGATGYNPTGGAAVVSGAAAAVPLPASSLLLLAGVAGFGVMRRRKRA